MTSDLNVAQTNGSDCIEGKEDSVDEGPAHPNMQYNELRSSVNSFSTFVDKKKICDYDDSAIELMHIVTLT